MRFFNRTMLVALISIFIISCTKDDEGERLKGQVRIITETSGANFDSNGKYGVTFTGLTGEDIGSEVGSFEMGYNDDTLVELNRVGELLSVILYNIPDNCMRAGETEHFDSLFNGILVPLDGSVVETTFTVECN